MVRALVSSQTERRPRLRVVRVGGVAFRVDASVLAMTGLALAALLALSAWALTLGSYRLPLAAVIAALSGSGSDEAQFIVLDLRLPRILAAVLIGPMLAMSGAIFQGLVRNPLVSPDVIGVNAGAAFVAVFWITTRHSPAALPLVAFAGAVVAASIVYLLSWRGHIAGPRLILVGIGVNAALSAATSFMVVRAEINDASRAVLWMTGSVYASTWNDVRTLALALAVLGPVGIALMWSLRVIQAGDLVARSVGMPLERVRLSLILVGCGLSAVAVSVAGPIGFVALMVPHLARMLAGPMCGSVFAFTGVLGALLLLGADMVGQHALPVGLPVGVVTAAVGAPYFLYLLYRVNARL
ncbi:iron ABC transporter permease [Thermomicrobiaceae bacterium CFH 74404]|uniref:Iron ABC transporter permease n=1 Tax=Thermalbibacter longus TaxID=2951981 RepID=A0AA41WFU3_9BACT|nr:iron ABC transporter permease [Thermalbibacter longus]MCM8750308.1 iron ABC transporter permease [Thermalbibacter longus]